MCCDARAGPDDAPAQAVRDAGRLRQPEPHIQRRGDVHRRGRWVRGGTERPLKAVPKTRCSRFPRSKKVAKLFSETRSHVPRSSIFFDHRGNIPATLAVAREVLSTRRAARTGAASWRSCWLHVVGAAVRRIRYEGLGWPPGTSRPAVGEWSVEAVRHG